MDWLMLLNWFVFRLNNTHLCGAAILSPEYGITAGHCLRRAGKYSVKDGSTDLSTGGVVVPVKQAIVHPGNNNREDDYDIALLKFSEPLRFVNFKENSLLYEVLLSVLVLTSGLSIASCCNLQHSNLSILLNVAYPTNSIFISYPIL